MISAGMVLKKRYEIIDEIGRGGMAVVYRIRDHALKKDAAMKVLKESLQKDDAYLRRFIREAQAAAALSHPNIVDVYDVDEDQGHWFIVMELVDGVTLKQYIQSKGHLSPKECIGITLQAADALQSAHQAGVIHRDIKPDNMIITTKGNVKISDFGIARVQSNDTMTVDACGSVYYSSPEQVRGGYSDQRTDIYSLGATMYEMVTGKLPFNGKTVVEIAMMHMEGNVIPPKQLVDDIPENLNQVILKAMSRRMDNRYQTMGELLQDLKICIKNPNGVSYRKIKSASPDGSTMVYSTSDREDVNRRLSSSSQASGKGSKNQGSSTASYVSRPPREEMEVKRRRKADHFEAEEEETEVDAGLTRALNIGLIIIIFVIVLFVLEFVFSSLGMFKGLTNYMPSVGNFGEWLKNLTQKLNAMNIGEYLSNGFKRIMDIFKGR